MNLKDLRELVRSSAPKAKAELINWRSDLPSIDIDKAIDSSAVDLLSEIDKAETLSETDVLKRLVILAKTRLTKN